MKGPIVDGPQACSGVPPRRGVETDRAVTAHNIVAGGHIADKG